MNIVKNKSNSLLIFTVCILLCGALNATSNVDKNITTDQKIISKKVVATVNGKNIYEGQLEKSVTKQLRKDGIFKSSGTSDGQVNLLRLKILNDLIDKEILQQASLKEPILDIDKKIELEIALIKKNFGEVDKYKNYLSNKHMTDKEFKTYLSDKIYLNEYLKKNRVIEPEIDEKEIRSFYDNGKKNFKIEELIKASQILLLIEPDATQKQRDKIKEKADKLRELIVNGEDFEKLAKEHSQSAEANVTGGKLGIIKKGYMPKAFEKVAFSMKKGELSKPIVTEFGYHIIKVTDRQEAGVSPYEEVKDFIRKFLQEKETIKMLNALKQKLKSEAKVEVLLNKK